MVLQEYDNRASNPTGEGVPWQIDRGTNRKDTPMCTQSLDIGCYSRILLCLVCSRMGNCVCKMLHFDMALAGGWDNVRDPAVCGYYARDGSGGGCYLGRWVGQ